MIVEDDQIVANIYRNKFSVEGFQVEVALDGNAGMELMRSFRPDAVILDLMLPKATGVEVMKQIRSEPAFGEPLADRAVGTDGWGGVGRGGRAGREACSCTLGCRFLGDGRVVALGGSKMK